MMDNPFAKFDQPKPANPFAKFDQPTTQELVEKIPAEKPTVSQRQDVPYGEAAAKSGGLAGAIYGAARAARPVAQQLRNLPPHPATAIPRGAGYLIDILGRSPVETVASGALSGVAGEAVRRSGGGEGAALAAEIGAGAVPSLAKGAARRTYESLLGTPSEKAEELARRASEQRITLEPGQVRQDVRQAAITGGTADIAKQNQRRFNEIASEATGQRAAVITDDYLGNRMNAVGNEIGAIIQSVPMYDPYPAINQISNLLTTELAVGSPTASVAARNILANLERRATQGAGLPATEMQRFRSELGRVIRTSQDPQDRFAASNVIEVLDDLVMNQLPTAQQQALTTARTQYRAAATLNDLYKRGGIDPNGNLSPEKLGNYLLKKDALFSRGQSTNPVAGLGELGRQFKLRSLSEPQMPRGAEAGEDAASSTAKALTRFGRAAMGGGIGYGATQSPLGMAIGTGLGMAAPEIASALTRTPGARLVQRAGAPFMREPAMPRSPRVATGVGAAELTKGETNAAQKR
jgi:hypothetical protein